MAALTRPLILAGVLLALLAFAAPSLLRHAPDLRGKIESLNRAEAGAGRQSPSQISPSEFAGIQPGSSPRELRALVGEPASRATTTVEGVEVECWYYGVGGETGAYQLCFENDRLSTKLRYQR